MKPIARLIGAGNRQPGAALVPSQVTLSKSNSRLWKASCRHRWLVIFSTALALLSSRAPALAEPGNQAVVAPAKYLGLSLSGTAGKVVTQKVLHRYGIPFLAGTLQLPHGGSAQVKVGCRARRIFLLGMTATPRIGCWADPRNQAARCFIGDELGRIELNYADGSTETFPLISGESLWWGQTFYRSPGPFPTDATFRKALASALRLYPPTPVKDGNYVAVITPRPIPLRSITFESSAAKWATPIIAGVTFEHIGGTELAGAIALAPQKVPAGFKTFVRTKALRAVG